MDYDELFPGRFLKSGEFKGRDVTLTINRVRTEELPDEKAGMKVRGILTFRETKKELVLNRTNGECVKAMWGRNTDDWIGKRLTLFPAPYTDSFTGEVGTAIRVRGSPDIDGDIHAEIKLPKKKPMRWKLARTGQKQQPKPNPKQQPKTTEPTPEPEAPADEMEEEYRQAIAQQAAETGLPEGL